MSKEENASDHKKKRDKRTSWRDQEDQQKDLTTVQKRSRAFFLLVTRLVSFFSSNDGDDLAIE